MFGFCGCCGWRRPLLREPIEEIRPRRSCFCGCCGWGRHYAEPVRREIDGYRPLRREREEIRHEIHREFPRTRNY